MARLPNHRIKLWTLRTLSFVWRVLKRFFANKGLLLAGAVGYNALLSIVPLLAVVLFILSFFIEEAAIFSVIATEIEFALPGQAAEITEVLRNFLEDRDVFGGIAIGVLLFLSTLAFRMLEDAMEVVFRHHKVQETRHPLISAGIAFAYIMTVSLGLLMITVVATTYEAVEDHNIVILSTEYSLAGYSGTLLKVAGFFGIVVLIASFYRVLPVARVRYKLALIGGFVAAVLWEITRSILVYYFSSISLVNVVYGSLATVVIVLLSMEIAALILLLGAQVIAELELSAESGVAWWQEPTKKPPPSLITGEWDPLPDYRDAGE